MSFIFTCKEETHSWLTETLKNSYLGEKTTREWNGRHHMLYWYRWLNGVDIRDNPETMAVNYVYLEIAYEEKKQITYKHRWITNKAVSEDNVAWIAKCGRARWKIENEHTNVLKNHGYNLEHNFGHGEDHASEMFCLLNLLGFLYHGIVGLADEEYQRARTSVGWRTEFFSYLRAALWYVLHESGETFFVFVCAEDPDG